MDWCWLLLACLPAALLPSVSAGDTALYLHYGQRLVGGLVPYKDFSAEYPPLALFLMGLPALLTQHAQGYRYTFQLMLLLLDLGCKWACVRTFSLSPAWFWPTSTACTMLLLGVYFNHFDVAPMTFAVLAVVAWHRWPQARAGWLCLAAAVGLKVVPIVLAPLGVLMCQRAEVSWRVIGRRLGLCSVLIALPLGAAYVAAGPKSWGWLLFHRDRGLHVASSYAAIGYLWHGFGCTLPFSETFGSVQIEEPWARLCAKASSLVTALFEGLTLWLAWRQPWRLAQPIGVLAGLFCGLLLANKAFSPQYMTWLVVPAVAAATASNPQATWRLATRWQFGLLAAILMACVASSQLDAWELPMIRGDGYRQAWLLVRLLSLATLWCLLAAAPRDLPRSKPKRSAL